MGWKRFFRRDYWDEVRAREIESYLDLETAENIARGMSVEEARCAARRKLGNRTAIREEIYHMNSAGFLQTLCQDLRFGARMLRKSMGSTIVAGLSLALGIGATTALFSAVYGVLISPYPYAKPGEIWSPEIRNSKNPKEARSFYRITEYLELKKLPAVSEAMATSPENALLTGDRPPENFRSVQVTANAFQFLGVPPVLGRTIIQSDVNAAGEAEPVIVLAYKAWKRLFNGSADCLGKKLILNDKQYTVVGVMPPRFGWWTDDSGWVPLGMDVKKNPMAATIVRLKPGVSKNVAGDQFDALILRLAKEHPDDFPREGFHTLLINYLDITAASGEMQSSLTLLFGAVAFLLLIACANVANLQMARATVRAREIAVRMSLGAPRSRILRQLLTESVLLSLAGGAAGVAFAVAITKGMVSLMPEFNVPNEARITVNEYVLAFSAGVSVLTGILFGLAPAIQCSRPDLMETLKDAARGSSTGSAGARTRNLLVLAEVSLSVILLVAASLTIRAFLNLQNADTGFQKDGVLIVGLPLPAHRYSTYEQRITFTENVMQRVQGLPGVEAVAIGNGGVPFGGPRSGYSIEGQPRSESNRILVGLISSGYLRALGIPLHSGRALDETDVVHGSAVAMINEAAAKLWPAGKSPIGGRIKLDLLERAPGGVFLKPGAGPYVTVVGVVGDVKNTGLRNPAAPAVYVPYTLLAPTGRTLALRTRSSPMLLLNAVRKEVQAIDKDQPLSRPLTLEEVVGFDTVQPRFNMALFSVFAGLGLALAAVGIFSVLSYAVARRTHEIGIRMALGAVRADVLKMVLASGGKVVAAGLAIGLVGSYALSRFVRSEYFAVPNADIWGILSVIALLSAAALLACVVPARRAARVEPTLALRHE